MNEHDARAPVPLYLSAPTFAIEMEELEQSARERASLLVLLSSLDAQAWHGRQGAAVPTPVQENVFYQQLAAGNARLDLTSHYALRLAFCKTRGADWLWLIDAESRLFTLRLAQTGAQQSVVTLSELGVTYEGERGDADSQSDTEPSDWTGFHRSRAPPSRQPARYRVPFEHAGRLVRRRQVEMQRGFCLVMAEDMRHVAVHHFKAMLLRQMNVLRRSLLMVSCDESARLDPVLGRVIASWQRDLVQQGSMGRSGLSARARIKLNEVDSASATHFPLCMRHLHRKFRENHHLKYDGRVQYRMFLKGLGLSVQESLLFFRSEFVKVIAPAKFDKEYAYHIRHSYGLEGSRKDYSPLDCHQILSGPAPRHGQHHGCPFKHWDSETLRRELGRCGLSSDAASRVAAEAASGRPQSACRALFDATHGVSYAQAMAQTHSASISASNMIVQHPNAYVDGSVAVSTASDHHMRLA